MKNNRYRAEELLTGLYHSGNSFLEKHPWEFEDDRWAELLVCDLVVEFRIEPQLARESVMTLKDLNMTSIGTLATAAAEHRGFIERVLVQKGFMPDKAIEVSDRMVALAKAVQMRWNGFFQRFLREYGEKMSKDLGSFLQTAGINGMPASKIAVQWLQIVSNIPVLLPGDPYIREFCKNHSLSDKMLLETADRLGLNVAVLDDLLALEAIAAREIRSDRSPKKRRARKTD